jgi:zinc D-Ala-D-Ala carboxypeptidase
LLSIVSASSADSIYGSVDAKAYLVGQFDPTLQTDTFEFIKNLPTQYPMMLRKEALAALTKMLGAFAAQYPAIPVPVLSATRNFTYQKGIWERKWSGSYSNITGELNRALAIMEFSAMPGSSRHHWGTDVDIFSLSNGDFSKGNGKVLYTWLVQNAPKYGFCQPFTRYAWNFPQSTILLFNLTFWQLLAVDAQDIMKRSGIGVTRF